MVRKLKRKLYFEQNMKKEKRDVEEKVVCTKNFGICYAKNDLKLCFDFLRSSYNDECDGYYYFNTKTKARQWEHPLDAEYKRLVEKARKFGTTGVNDLSDVIQF